MSDTFSDRHGYRVADAEITVREDAPEELRQAILMIAKSLGMTPTPMRDIVCQVLLKVPDPNNWSDYPNVWHEVENLIAECPWFKVYDIAEELNRAFGEKFAVRLNQFFREQGIGWEMRDGEIMFRGSDIFAEATAEASRVLTESGRTRAANEIQEALRDISRRPEPDVTGAIHHAMAALEATARDITGQPKRTLGQLVPELDLPQPLDKAIEKLWGYASDRARHGREGQAVDTAEGELLVSVAGAVCIFITKKNLSDS